MQPLDAEAWFTAEFLNSVPEQQIEQILTQYSTQLGALQRIEGEASPFTLVFELGTAPAEIYLDDQGKIIGIFFGSPTLFVASIDEALAQFEELPGEVAVLVTKNGEEIAALNAETPLGVGSGFKLAVLAVLKEQIEAGLHTWDEVMPLMPEWKAPPFSQLRAWPDNSPLTLHTLATLMISISDNTAADALLHIVGREEVEAISPRNVPFLTTQELFKLKAAPNAGLLEAYRSGDAAAKREVLEELAAVPEPQAQEISPMPILDVEWFFTAYELCDLMAEVEELELMTVQPGPAGAQTERWSRIAFKGGSELGVLHFTTWLETEAGDSYCVTATQNLAAGPVDQAQLETLYLSLITVIE